MFRRLTVYVFLIVISDPYRGLNYNRINTYSYSHDDRYLEDVIHVYSASDYPDDEVEAAEERDGGDDSDSDSKTSTPSSIFIPWFPLLK